MDEKRQKSFCETLEKSSQTLELQLPEFTKNKFWSTAKRRTDSLKNLESEKQVCKLIGDKNAK